MTTIAPTIDIARLSPPVALRPKLEGRFRLDHVSDDALHAGVKTLAGRYNVLTADLLAHLAEVDARGIYRERACSSLYTYCVYELRLSEDEAQRRAKAARTAREFPALFEMLAEGAIHLTGLLLLAPYLTRENHVELLARARFRTKREIEHLVSEIAPRPDVPARIEPLGPRRVANLWQAYTASLRGAVRELPPGVTAGDAPPVVLDESNDAEAPKHGKGHDGDEGGAASTEASPDDVSDAGNGVEVEVRANDAVGERVPAPARMDGAPAVGSKPLAPQRYRVEFTASARYVELLEEARNLLQHQVPDRDVARVHELSMEAFVEQLRKRRRAETSRQERAVERSAPARVPGTRDASARGRTNRYVPAGIRRAVWRRDEGRCTFEDASGRRCDERAGLEIHHEHAFALGGSTTLENLRLLCRAHNGLLAERDFGREHVERMKNPRDGTTAP
jgi:5-methylcytosine-specific restriction endonuclease McrA